MSVLLGALVLAAVLGVAAPAAAQAPAPPAPPAQNGAHPGDSLDCAACHKDKHQGIVRMYAGTGGRGAPPSPDAMFRVHVQCVACHTTPRSAAGAAAIVGQDFAAGAQPCVGCHEARYGAMPGRWAGAFAKMRETLAPKVAHARAALAAAGAKDARHAKARRLVDDAEFNARFVDLANGAHNVLYAANLLRRANGWLDEAAGLLGKTPPKSDDALLRGGYCATLCHEPAGMKLRETVTFRGTKLPHARHAGELGAACTTCHSADVHKALAATPTTCSSCHHAPQNDKCESCHRNQSAFYQGTVKTTTVPVAPNVMAAAVGCTGCHDFSKPRTRAAIGEACLACHERTYLPLFAEWTTAFQQDVRAAAAAVAAAETATTQARRAGRRSAEAEALVKEARESVALVRAGGAAHNPLAAEALLAAARRAAERARGELKAGR